MNATNGIQAEIGLDEEVLIGDEPEKGVVFENLPGPPKEEDPFEDTPEDLRKKAEMDLAIALTTICEPEEGIRFEDLPPLSTKNCWQKDPFRDRSKDPLVQGELIKFKFEPDDFKDFNQLDFEIACGFAGERKHDRNVKYASTFFPKEKLKPEPHSQKVRDEQVAMRRKKRPRCILKADGTFGMARGAYPISFAKQSSSLIVVNGQFPEEDIRPITTVIIETLT